MYVHFVILEGNSESFFFNNKVGYILKVYPKFILFENVVENNYTHTYTHP